jgi:hypothetical protein
LFDIGSKGSHLKWGLFFKDQKIIKIENATIQYNFKNDLVEHLWVQKGNNMYRNKYFGYSISNIFKNLFGCDEVCESIYVSSSCLCKCDELLSVIEPSCESSTSEVSFRTF